MRALRATFAASVLMVGAGSIAMAADLPVKAVTAAPVAASSLYMSVYGQYIVSSDPRYRVGVLAPELVDSNNGFAGGILAGWRFADRWDIAAAYSVAHFADGSPVTVFSGRDGGRYSVVDANVGYSLALLGMARLGIGVRHTTFTHEYRENVAGIKERFRGFGPRGTFDWSKPISGPWVLALGLGGGPLFGDIKSYPSAPFPAPSGSQTVWNYDGYLGIGYQFGLMNLMVGWRAEHWTNLHSVQFGVADGRADRTAHGPFFRLSYNTPTAGR